MSRPLRMRTSWFRRYAALIVVCFIAALTIGPTVDALVCGVDSHAAQQSVFSVSDASTLATNTDPADKGEAGLCQHGHCHHSVSVAPATDLIGLALIAEQAHVLVAETPHHSFSPSGPDDVPRA